MTDFWRQESRANLLVLPEGFPDPTQTGLQMPTLKMISYLKGLIGQRYDDGRQKNLNANQIL